MATTVTTVEAVQAPLQIEWQRRVGIVRHLQEKPIPVTCISPANTAAAAPRLPTTLRPPMPDTRLDRAGRGAMTRGLFRSAEASAA